MKLFEVSFILLVCNASSVAKLTEGSDWLALSCDFIPKSVILLTGMGSSKWLGLDCVTSPGFGGQLGNYGVRMRDSWPPKEILKRRKHSFS